MIRVYRPSGRVVAFSVMVALLTGCSLPRTGPTKNEIFAGSVQKEGDAFIVTVDDRVATLTSVSPSSGFPKKLIEAPNLGSDTIRAGDTLGLRIWENVEDGLLASAGTGGAALQEIQVDGNGFIFVPYAGRVRAAGNSPEAIRRIITEKLEAQTPDPQVLVNRLAGDGATVSLIGNVGGQGVYPIERPTRTLTAMIAQAGGVTLTPEITQVTLIRGHESGTVWLDDLYRDPSLDIALRAGDRILVEQDTRFFTALGATGAQTRIQFPTQTITAVEAMANVGGLSPALADPTGIFVFREESADVANSVLARRDLQGDQRMVYVLDLTTPNGVFLARDFLIRDGDTLYVTEAPFSQFNKILAAALTPLSAASSVSVLTE